MSEFLKDLHPDLSEPFPNVSRNFQTLHLRQHQRMHQKHELVRIAICRMSLRTKLRMHTGGEAPARWVVSWCLAWVPKRIMGFRSASWVSHSTLEAMLK